MLISETSDQPDIDHRLKLASAAMMLEMINVDGERHETEEKKFRELLKREYELSEDETNALIELANEEKTDATDYYRFTSLINQHYSQQQKIQLVEQLWRLAYADGNIDRYEEHLVRKLAELLHVPHADFIQSKHRASS